MKTITIKEWKSMRIYAAANHKHGVQRSDEDGVIWEWVSANKRVTIKKAIKHRGKIMKLTAAQKAYRVVTTDFCNDKAVQFVANVIMTSCNKPATKLKNLIKLLLAGHKVRTAQFNMYSIIVDGIHIGSYSYFIEIRI